jgi:hypothetical protein
VRLPAGSSHRAGRDAYAAPVIEPIDDVADGVIGMSAVGQFTIEDYNQIVEPAIEQLAGEHGGLRLLLFLGLEFTGFGDGAWGELTTEIRHTRFHRGAVVTDDGHIRSALNVLKWMLHGEVRTFHDAEYDRAVHWVTS